jgi:hypothetical protein
MPGHNNLNEPADGEAEPSRLSRRSVLRGAAGAGAAGIAATAFTGMAGPALAATRPEPHHTEPHHTEPRHTEPQLSDEESAEQLVVRVRDARSGEIDIFRGTSHTTRHDRELAARLVRASRR